MTRTAPARIPPSASSRADPAPVALVALLASVGLIHAASPTAADRLSRPAVEVRRFAAGATTVELICDDAIAVARASGVFADHVTTQPGQGWAVSILRTPSLSAAPRAFAGCVSVEIDVGVTALYARHVAFGDAWWVSRHDIVLHNVPPSRRVGVRYTDPRAARSWAPTLVGRLLFA